MLPVREADAVLAQLCAALPVDVLPGASDPVNHALPQQPLHACSRRAPRATSTLHAHTNPFAAAVGGALRHGRPARRRPPQVLDARAAAPAADAAAAEPAPAPAPEGAPKPAGGGAAASARGTRATARERCWYGDGELAPLPSGAAADAAAPEARARGARPTRRSARSRTRSCGGTAPTAPDTLATYPHFEQDPFVLAEAPHVYFAGNTKEFATSLVESQDGRATTRVVCVPCFADTGVAVLVHLGTLECTPLQFGVATAAVSMETGA